MGMVGGKDVFSLHLNESSTSRKTAEQAKFHSATGEPFSLAKAGKANLQRCIANKVHDFECQPNSLRDGNAHDFRKLLLSQS